MKPVVLLGEAFGENEAKIGAAFVGASGIELLRMCNEAKLIELTSADYDYINKFFNTGDPTFVDLAWRLHPEVHRTNVFNQHPPGNKLEWFCGGKAEGINSHPAIMKPSKYVRKEFEYELERLGDELLSLDPNLIVCLGNTPLWALSGKTGVSKLRGTTSTSSHIVSDFKLISTYHPAAVLRQWELRPTSVIDLMKARRESAYPEIRRPKCEIWIEPAIEDMERFYVEHILPCKNLAVDIETAGSKITCVGFSPKPTIALVVPFLDTRKKNGNYWASKELEISAWGIIRRVLEDREIRKTFQNGMYDIAFIWRSTGLKVYGASEDTMLAHHSLQPESLKSLGFLGSVYTDHGSWKSDRRGVTTIKRDE